MSTLDATFVPVKSCFHSRQLVRLVILLLLLQLLAPLPNLRLRHIQAAALPPTVAPPPTKAASASRIAEKLGQMPMTFEQNLGQTDDRVKFTARGQGYQLFLTPTAARLSLPQGKNKRPHTLQMQLIGGNPNPMVTGLDQTETVSNYYLGNDPSKFRTGVPHFARVKYAQVYPGIDAVYYGQGRMLEYDFIVAPGVDPKVIQMTFKGAQKLLLDTNGDLVIQTKGGELRHHKPVVYQEVNGARQAIAGSFVLRGKQVGFAIGEYDRSKELVIDPTLNYSSYLGGYDGDEKGYAIAVGSCANGNCDAYVTGEVASTSFGDVSFPGSAGDKDVFVSRVNTTGTGVSFYTFIGGTEEDYGKGITVDGSGNSYVVGILGDFTPGVSGGVQATDPDGNYQDGFVAKLNSLGAVTAFTFLGGSNLDMTNGVALSGTDVCVVGDTYSTNLPTPSGSPNPADASHNGQRDAFVAKLNSSLSTLSYMTYLGGSNMDYGNGIAVNSGKLYVVGTTQSTNTTFPETTGALDTQETGTAPVDAFVAKLDPANGGSGDLNYCTYLGGNGRENGWGIAVNGDGQAIVTGQTHSGGVSTSGGYSATSIYFPCLSEYNLTQAGAGDVFVTRLNATGTAVVYSTLFGGSDLDVGYAIALHDNVAYIAGETDSTDLPLEPVLSPLQINQTGTDAFVAKINTAGSGSGSLTFSTYHAGNSTDSGRGIAYNNSAAYVVGFTNSYSDYYASGTFPAVPVSPSYPYQEEIQGYYDAFVAKITP